MPRGAVIASDDFNRESLGANWAQLNSFWGNIAIASSSYVYGTNSNRQPGDGAAARWVGAGTFTADQWASVQIVALPYQSATYNIGVICRASGDTDSNRDYYFAAVSADSPGPNYTTTLGKVVNGTRTVLYSASVPWAVGDRIELEVEGSTLRVCKNGTALGGSWTVTDTSLTAGQPGVLSGGSVVGGDNWEAGGFSAGGGGLPPGLRSDSQVDDIDLGYAARDWRGLFDQRPSALYAQQNTSTDATTAYVRIVGAEAQSQTQIEASPARLALLGQQAEKHVTALAGAAYAGLIAPSSQQVVFADALGSRIAIFGSVADQAAGSSFSVDAVQARVFLRGQQSASEIVIAADSARLAISAYQASHSTDAVASISRLVVNGKEADQQSQASYSVDAQVARLALSASAVVGDVSNDGRPPLIRVYGLQGDFSVANQAQAALARLAALHSQAEIANRGELVSASFAAKDGAFEIAAVAEPARLPIHGLESQQSVSGSFIVVGEPAVIAISVAAAQQETAAAEDLTAPKYQSQKRRVKYPNLQFRPPSGRKEKDDDDQNGSQEKQKSADGAVNISVVVARPTAVGRGIRIVDVAEIETAAKESAAPERKAAEKQVEPDGRQRKPKTGAKEKRASVPQKDVGDSPNAGIPVEAKRLAVEAPESAAPALRGGIDIEALIRAAVTETKSAVADEFAKAIQAVRAEIEQMAHELNRERRQRYELEREFVRKIGNRAAIAAAKFLIDNEDDDFSL